MIIILFYIIFVNLKQHFYILCTIILSLFMHIFCFLFLVFGLANSKCFYLTSFLLGTRNKPNYASI
ncbi:hypothetical protein CLOSCI_00385 [[Clostridium] scindens ATCC 35704]|nr:hypothetical protein CLOSCI_00385 [[Clostridium] scindens ATCC 35704]